MQKVKVTLWEKYHYEVVVSNNPTLEELAWAISLAVHEKEKKTKFTGKPRTYNYIKEALLRHSAHNFRFNAVNPAPDMTKQIYAAANELNAKSKPEKVECQTCKGTGKMALDFYYAHKLGEPQYKPCFICNGHGYLFERQVYRVGNTFSEVLAIDIDGKDKENLIDVQTFYENVLQLKFEAWETNSGYWLIGNKRYANIDEFKFAHCQVLDPELSRDDYKNYIKQLLSLDKKNNGGFHGASAEDIRKSNLFHGHGKFDVAFTFLSIKRGRSTLRESRKNKDDKIKKVKNNRG